MKAFVPVRRVASSPHRSATWRLPGGSSFEDPDPYGPPRGEYTWAEADPRNLSGYRIVTTEQLSSLGDARLSYGNHIAELTVDAHAALASAMVHRAEIEKEAIMGRISVLKTEKTRLDLQVREQELKKYVRDKSRQPKEDSMTDGSDFRAIISTNFEQAREGAFDGMSASLADVGVSALAKRAKGHVPEGMLSNKFIVGLLTFAVPWIVLGLIAVLGDRVPKADALRKQAERAVRGLSSRYASSIMTEGLSWLIEIADAISDGGES